MNKRKAVLITGASSGIGLEFSHFISNNEELLNKSDHDIILVARREDRLKKLKEILSKNLTGKNQNVIYFSLDLSLNEDREKLFNNIKDDYFISLLINNAGFGSYGTFEESTLSKELQMVDLNIKAVVHLCHLFSKEMIEKKQGEIINVSSMAGFQGLPYLATYAATKAFVTSFSLALATELKEYGIKVQTLCPGPVQTEFVMVSGFPDKISLVPSVSAYDVSKLSLTKLKSGQRIVIPGILNILLAQLNRFLPRATATDVAKAVLKKKFRAEEKS